MSSFDIVVETPIARSVRVQQLEGIFDLPREKVSHNSWKITMPLDQKEWQIGLIVGASGSGKSTIARRVFGDHLVDHFNWSDDKSVVDDFPESMSIKKIVSLMSAVGFSSPPSWLRPYKHLSNGEQFRVFIARALAADRARDPIVIDEFTSVVDRTVAKISSAAFSKIIRRAGRKFVAVTCHEDIQQWLQPDWVYRPSANQFIWRSLQRRPDITLEICRVHPSAWQLFSRHHYLTNDLHRSATCFVGYLNGYPAVFHSYLPFVGRLKDSRKAMRGHRSVCLPDYQGVGLGHAMITCLASMWAALDYRVFRNSGHPAEIAAANRSADWRMIRSPSLITFRGDKRLPLFNATRAGNRLTASYEFCGRPMDKSTAAKLLGKRGLDLRDRRGL